MKNWVKISLSVLLFITVLTASFYFSHRAEFSAQIGNFYLKQGNDITAQKYFEKSYSLGNTGRKFREDYTNLLINSPLNIKAQEKLVQIANDGTQDNAKESAAYFLYNLKREIHNKFPENYIQQGVYNHKIVHWGKMPITYSIKQTKDISPEITASVNDAFDTWERVSSARIKFEKVNINADIAINFIKESIKEPENGLKYVVAYTIPEIAQNKLIRMNTTINVINPDGLPFSSNQIYNTALHEIFHALGFMGHSQNPNSIMYMSGNSKTLINDERREISDADKTTLELLYKIKPDITNANELNYDYIPYLVLGSNIDVNFAKTKEAENYIKNAPNVPAGYIDLAQTLLHEGNYNASIYNLKRAYKLSKNDYAKHLVLYNMAVVYYYEGDYTKSVFYVQKAMEIEDTSDLHLLLAEIYLKQKNIKNGIKEYEYLIKQDKDNLNYTINLANLYIKKYNYLKARNLIKEYIKIHPKEKNNPRFAPYKILLF